MQARLSKRIVDSISPGNRDTFVWDTDVKGFGLKVTPAGRKVYVVQTRINGRLRRYTIGRHGSPWTPDMARNEALTLLADTRQGKDPADEKRAKQTDLTISELCDLYLAEGCEGKKQSTITLDRSRIERHVKPLLGKKHVKTLIRADLERFMADVAVGKTAIDERTRKRGRAIVKGGRGAANRTLEMIGAMLEFAVNRGLRPSNPARGIRRYKDQTFERFLTSEELIRLGQALRAASDRGENGYAIAAILFLLLTGCRKGEALTLQWPWVDLERACLRLPDSKTGAKVVPLGEPVLRLLESLPRIEGNPHVFPGAKEGGHLIGIQKIWARIRSEADLGDLRLHDLRHHFISVGASSGESLYILGKVAGHKQAATTQRYAHLADDPVKGAADRIASVIALSVEPKRFGSD